MKKERNKLFLAKRKIKAEPNVEDKLNKVEKLCVLIAHLCNFLKILFFLMGFFFIAQAILGISKLYNLEWIEETTLNIVNNLIFPLNALITLEKYLPVDRTFIIMGSVGTFSLGWSFLFASIRSIFRGIGKGKTPFNYIHIRKLKKISLVVFLLGIFQPVFIVFSLIILCISYIFEYGNILEKKAAQTVLIQEEVILAFAEITEAKSGQTGKHVKRVAEYSKVLAKGLQLDADNVEEIQVASMMHDVGKLLIPQEIIEKPGKLTKEEFNVIKTHVTLGEKLLHNAEGKIMERARRTALDHHEKWNGSGYLGKAQEEISLEGRIVAVADVFDALVSKRSYKTAWSAEDAYQEIVNESGKHFEPRVVEIFKEQYDEFLNVMNKYRD